MISDHKLVEDDITAKHFISMATVGYTYSETSDKGKFQVRDNLHIYKCHHKRKRPQN